jgi:UDP-N-acetylmuramoyl-L-alanyl-D-glutamate--2,6-diaminopimelate ligase
MKLDPLLNLGRKIIPKPLFRLGQPVYHFILAVSGNIRYGFPGTKLVVIGVTGTNGKSTTVEMVNSALKANGLKTHRFELLQLNLLSYAYDDSSQEAPS